MLGIVTLATVFAVTVSAVPLLSRQAERFGLVDEPGGRKDHACAVPLIGGIAIFLGVSVGAAAMPALPPMLVGALLGMAGYVLLGCLDDRIPLGGAVKLAIQVAIATAVVVGFGGAIPSLGDLFGTGPIALAAPWSHAFAVFVIVGLVNAVNMADGVDGLAAGVVLIALFWLSVAAELNGVPQTVGFSLLLGAGVTGFLLFNYRSPICGRAVVFLGDAGSMMLGFAIAWLGISVLAAVEGPVTPAGMGWIVALPAVDTLSLMVRRIRRGRSPFSADREHLHHVFLLAGFSPIATTNILIGLELFLGGFGVVGCWAGVPDVVLFGFLLPFVMAHGFFVYRAWRTMKALKRIRRMRPVRARFRAPW